MNLFEEVKQKYNLRGLNPDRLSSLKRYGGESILDVGCGSGAYVFNLRNEKTIKGVDYQSFDSWKESPDLFTISDASSLPFENSSFDTISCFETLEHLKNPDQALSEFRRVTRGNLIISVPNCDVPSVFSESNLIFSHWNDPTHINFFNKESLVTLVENNGFKVTDVSLINKVRLDRLFRKMLSSQGTVKKYVFEKFFMPEILEKHEYFITILLIAKKI